MDELVEAIKEMSEDSLKNDRALLNLIEALIKKVEALEKRVDLISRLGDFKQLI